MVGMANVARPTVSGGTASTTLAARSVTTYVFDQKGHGSSAVTGALQGKQSGKCLTAGTSGAAISTCTGGTEQSWSYDGKGALKGPGGYLTAASSGLTTTADFTGDGLVASFEGPARAVRCAFALRDRFRSLGLEIRAGLHTGEVERRREGMAGGGGKGVR